MADNMKNAGDAPEVALDLDDQTTDIEAAMRDAVAAVEGVESGARGEAPVLLVRPVPPPTTRRSCARRPPICATALTRTLADFDNFRKRAERDRQEQKRYALFDPLREFLTVTDNLDLALSAQGPAEDLKRGVEMIHRQMIELLRRFGVTEVSAVGQPFDPTVHEAVAREESAEVKSPTVSAELRRGYKLHERLLRPAMVKVAVPAEAPAPVTGGGGSGEEGPAL